MTDIAKCHGDGCPWRSFCYRYTAPAGEYQSWLAYEPFRSDTQTCDLHWPLADEPRAAATFGAVHHPRTVQP